MAPKYYETYYGTRWCLPSETDMTVICTNEITARKAVLKMHSFVLERRVDESGQPEWFEEFCSTNEQPERIPNPNYKPSVTQVFPGTHYRDITYAPASDNSVVNQVTTKTNWKEIVFKVVLVIVVFCIVYQITI